MCIVHPNEQKEKENREERKKNHTLRNKLTKIHNNRSGLENYLENSLNGLEMYIVVAARSLHSMIAASICCNTLIGMHELHAVGTLHTCLLLSNFQQMHLLDISRQLACVKLGRREKYQPIQCCWAGCLGYPVHTCHLPIDIQQIYCSVQTGQHSCLRHSCCPVWALQHICTL